MNVRATPTCDMCRQELDFERGTIAVNGRLFCSYRCLCQHVRDTCRQDNIENCDDQWFKEGAES